MFLVGNFQYLGVICESDSFILNVLYDIKGLHEQ